MAENQLQGQGKKQPGVVSQVKGKLSEENIKARFTEVLGKKAPQFMASIVNVVSTSTQLKKCQPNSIIAAAFIAASFDLPIDSNLGFAALVPYDKKVTDPNTGQTRKVKMAQFQMMYKGFIQLAIRTGEYEKMNCSAVYGDEIIDYNPITGECQFVTDFGACEQRSNGKTDKIVGYYAWFRLKSGFTKELYMSKSEVLNHAKKYSQSYRYDLNDNKKSSKWSTDFDAMALKGLALDTKIPTPDGWLTIGEIKVGDSVFDMNGIKTKVIAVSEIKNLPCFKIIFANNESVICDNEHKWLVQTGTNASRNLKKHGWEEMTSEQMYGLKKKGIRMIVPNNPALQTDITELPIEPWVLGYWLGNGAKQNARVTCCEDDLLYIKDKIAEAYEIGTIRKDARNRSVDISIKSGFITLLKENDLYMNKHIPKIYKRAAENQRLALLRGLMDSDGTVSKNRGRFIYNTTDWRLADDVYELVSSIGEMPCISENFGYGYGKKVKSYAVMWKPKRNVSEVGMPRKIANLKERKVYSPRGIKTIEKVKSVPTRCIAVDSETRTYLVGKSMIPTHNTVIKLLISKWGILSIEMQKAITDDQKTFDEDGNESYGDNQPDAVEAEDPFAQIEQKEDVPEDETEEIDITE